MGPVSPGRGGGLGPAIPCGGSAAVAGALIAASLSLASCGPRPDDARAPDAPVADRVSRERPAEPGRRATPPSAPERAAAAAAVSTAPREVAGYAMRHVPPDGRIVIAEPGCRDWGPDLVHYRVDARRFAPGKLALIDEEGKAVPFQIEGDVLAFVASVERKGTATWTLGPSDRDRSAESSTLKVSETREGVEVVNAFFTLRLPAPGRREHAQPVPAAEVPPPVLAWKQAGFGWIGRMRWSTPKKVASSAFVIVRRGPACFEYEARYVFAPEGRYVCRVQVVDGVPLARVTEELDGGSLKRNNEEFLLLDLHAGFRPSALVFPETAAETDLKEVHQDFAPFLERKRADAFKVGVPVGAEGKPLPPAVPEEGLWLLETIVPAGRWGNLKGAVGVLGPEPAGGDGAARLPGDEAAASAPQARQRVGLVPLSLSGWRRAMALNAWGKEGTGVVVGLPLDARWLWWQYDCADERSPFSTHEHDPGLEAAYARRVWGLHFGGDLHRAQARYGAIGLDRFKDWIVDWPEDPTVAYPRAWFTPQVVAEVKRCLDRHPDREALSRYYVMSGDPADAVRSAEAFLRRFAGDRGPCPQWTPRGLSHYRQAGQLKEAHLADDALASKDLDPELRARVRRTLALWSYLMSDPDFNPRGAGVHLGNNNMTINRTIALAYFASLIPDHPLYGYWMESLRDFARFKLATQTACDGTWVACPNYQIYGPLRFMDAALNICRNVGLPIELGPDYHAATLRYLADLTMPDPRFNGLRILPGMGNSGNTPESVWGLCMRAAGPENRGWLARMHRLSVGPNGVASLPANSPAYAFNFLADAPEADAGLGTTIHPTYGVIFRNHAGTPRETAMLFRAGVNWSHWDTDALNVILYAKGAPLSPGTGYGYGPGCISERNAIYHNRVKMAAHESASIFGRVDAPVRDYGFGASADYAMADRYVPPEHFADKRERHWRRHVMFMKSPALEGPSYFVMRDAFPGNPPEDRTWWTWLNLGEADAILVDGKPFDPAAVPHDRAPGDLDALPVLRGERLDMGTGFGAGTHVWFAGGAIAFRPRVTFEITSHLPFDPKLPELDFSRGLPGKREKKTILEGMAAPGGDYRYVIYPLADGDAPPRCRELEDGALEIVTPEARDFVFIGDGPFGFDREGVVFTGAAGCVRVFRDRVALCMTGGSGRVGYRGHVLEGEGPFERVVPLAGLEPGVHAVEGGYEKRRLVLDLGRGVKVEGEGPFEARLEGDEVRISTRGRARVIHVVHDGFLLRPQYWIDGREWMACWTDWPASGFGTYSRTDMVALTVPDGEHELVVREMAFPAGWRRAFAPLLDGVCAEGAGK